MKIVVLGSSSSGNSTYVEFGSVKFLIDVGLGFGDIKFKLLELGVNAKDLDFIIITHAHNDHVKSLHSFSRVYNTKVYIKKSTFDEYIKKDSLRNYEFVDDIDNIMGINIYKIPISHDKSGYGYVFEKDNLSLFYMTDTGMIHIKYFDIIKNRTVYAIESNHDVTMEMNGTKDEMTKIRNIGDYGHLSNDECAMYLSKFIGNNTKAVVLMHMSEHDNTYELAYNTNRESLPKSIDLYMSYKNDMSQVIDINKV